jgi:hypothetical protein
VDIKLNKSGRILLGVLAFAVVVYFAIPFIQGSKKDSNGEGLHHFSVKAFKEDSTWGYRIFQDTAAVIEQKSVPGIAGNAGFKTEEQAIKTGELVVYKLDRGIFPPTISKHELDSLGVGY